MSNLNQVELRQLDPIKYQPKLSGFIQKLMPVPVSKPAVFLDLSVPAEAESENKPDIMKMTVGSHSSSSESPSSYPPLTMGQLDKLVHSAFDSFPRSIILTDDQGKIVHANIQAQRLLKLEDESTYLNQNLHQVVHRNLTTHQSGKCDLNIFGKNSSSQNSQPLQDYSKKTNISDMFYTTDGEQVGVEYSLYPLFEKDKSDKLIGFMLRFAKESLSLRQKNQFLAALGHELKTPLTVIKSYNHLTHRSLKDCFQQLAAAQELSEKQTASFQKITNYFNVIDGKVNLLTQLIEGMLDTIKLGAGKLTFHDEKLDLDEEVREIISQLQKTIPTHHLKVSGQTNLQMKLDRKRLFQVLSNLISNAVKY
ncbi:MAG: PAS domain-containing protein, partial [Candidatus Pacebacteria bacterium]|nr:PAS domain-containing protein [Candidatus Paceibacterota bacterium]